MKRPIFPTILLIAGLYSCQSPNGADDGFVYTINLDNAKIIDAPLISEFCDDVRTIILGITDNVLLSGIDKLVSANGCLYVLDRKGRFVAEFGMDGRFIKQYGNVGRGPGEYIGLSDFSIDEQNELMYLLDFQTGRVMVYDLDSGKYVDNIRIDRNGMNSNAITSIGNLIYADLNYREYDGANYLMRSWNKADPAKESFYLPAGKHLEGWRDVSLINNSNFIYCHRNDYALFSNKYSPEIFKLTQEGIGKYVYIDSKDFIDKKGKQIVSKAWENHRPPANSPARILWDLDRFYGVCNYFETNRYICFMIGRGNAFPMFIYDKIGSAAQRTTFLKMNLIVKDEYPEFQASFMPLQADSEGVFYYTPPERLDKLREAARKGMLTDSLDRLEELKQLPDYSNSVIFYMKFKEPLR